jgi:glycosyltransferase involved in cell wall biosynthesis
MELIKVNPKLSIIVPVFNVERYIEKCINSILNQSFKDFELILIDDGSIDKSGQICDRHAQNDRRVKVIHKINEGPAVTRNIGLMIAKGEYIGFVDSDDWIDPNMYLLLYNSCIDNGSDISIIGLREVTENGDFLNQYVPNKMTFSEILKRAYPCNKIFKKELFVNNKLYFAEGKYYEDLELIPKLFIKSRKLTTVNQITYNYVKRKGSTTASQDKRILDNLWAYTQLKQFLIDENIYLEYHEEFKNGVSFFKKYYFNILYEYPTIFIIKNSKVIINDFKHIGGLSKEDYIFFIIKHINFTIKKRIFLYKKQVRRIFR